MAANTYTLNCKGKLLTIQKPIIMGIINATPDSFYDGGKHFNNIDAILHTTEQMLNEGATIIDIGGMSSRPNATIIPPKEELKRTIPAIERIAKNFPNALISIDTLHSQVAYEAVQAGACLVNDISAGGSIDPNLLPTVAALQVPYILMHSKGTPSNMAQLTDYNNVMKEITLFFSKKINQCTQLGIKDIILDIGIGFAKNIQQNFFLLKNLQHFAHFELPLLVGISRKSLIWKTLQNTPSDCLNGSTVLHTLSLQNGAQILRTHDVKACNETIKLIEAYNHS